MLQTLMNRSSIFDCTDYQDYKFALGVSVSSSVNSLPIAVRSLQQAALNLVDYLQLVFDHFIR